MRGNTSTVLAIALTALTALPQAPATPPAEAPSNPFSDPDEPAARLLRSSPQDPFAPASAGPRAVEPAQAAVPEAPAAVSTEASNPFAPAPAAPAPVSTEASNPFAPAEASAPAAVSTEASNPFAPAPAASAPSTPGAPRAPSAALGASPSTPPAAPSDPFASMLSAATSAVAAVTSGSFAPALGAVATAGAAAAAAAVSGASSASTSTAASAPAAPTTEGANPFAPAEASAAAAVSTEAANPFAPAEASAPAAVSTEAANPFAPAEAASAPAAVSTEASNPFAAAPVPTGNPFAPAVDGAGPPQSGNPFASEPSGPFEPRAPVAVAPAEASPFADEPYAPVGGNPFVRNDGAPAPPPESSNPFADELAPSAPAVASPEPNPFARATPVTEAPQALPGGNPFARALEGTGFEDVASGASSVFGAVLGGSSNPFAEAAIAAAGALAAAAGSVLGNPSSGASMPKPTDPVGGPEGNPFASGAQPPSAHENPFAPKAADNPFATPPAPMMSGNPFAASSDENPFAPSPAAVAAAPNTPPSPTSAPNPFAASPTEAEAPVASSQPANPFAPAAAAPVAATSASPFAATQPQQETAESVAAVAMSRDSRKASAERPATPMGDNPFAPADTPTPAGGNVMHGGPSAQRDVALPAPTVPQVAAPVSAEIDNLFVADAALEEAMGSEADPMGLATAALDMLEQVAPGERHFASNTGEANADAMAKDPFAIADPFSDAGEDPFGESTPVVANPYMVEGESGGQPVNPFAEVAVATATENPYAPAEDAADSQPVDPFAATTGAQPEVNNPYVPSEEPENVVLASAPSLWMPTKSEEPAPEQPAVEPTPSEPVVDPEPAASEPEASQAVVEPAPVAPEPVAVETAPTASEPTHAVHAVYSPSQPEPFSAAQPDVVATPVQAEQPRNPFALGGPAAATPTAEAVAAEPTSKVFDTAPAEPSVNYIPMRVDPRDADPASADGPPAPPPTLLPTWPTQELPEENRLRGAYMSTDGRWRIFTKEGVYTDYPPATPAPVDWDRHWSAGHRVALYRRTGDHATIEHIDGLPETLTVVRQPYALQIDGEPWKRTDYDLSGRTMKGRWIGDDGSQLEMDHQGRARLDGRPGRYRFSAGRVDLDFDDGGRSEMSFYSTLAPSSKHPHVVWVGGVQYKPSA